MMRLGTLERMLLAYSVNPSPKQMNPLRLLRVTLLVMALSSALLSACAGERPTPIPHPNVTVVPTKQDLDFLVPVAQPGGNWIAAEWVPCPTCYSKLVLVNSHNGEVKSLLEGKTAAGPAWLPDGISLSVETGGPEGNGIYIVKPFDLTTETPAFFRASGMANWSPDGQYVAISTGVPITTTAESSARWGAAITVINRETNEVRIVYQTPPLQEGDIRGMAWSPRGDQLAFAVHLFGASTGDGAGWSLFTVGSDGTDLRTYAVKGTKVWAPGWTPDGKWLFYVDANRASDGDQRLSFVSIDKGCEVNTNVFGIDSPSVAAGSEQLVYACYRRICMLDLKGLLGSHYEALSCT